MNWRRWEADDWFLAVLLGACGLLFAVVFGILVTVVPYTARAEATCLELGYPRVRIDWTLKGYCIKRVDQTDVVVALSELSKP